MKEIARSQLNDFVEIAATHVLEKSMAARKQTGSLLHDLCVAQALSADNFKTG